MVRAAVHRSRHALLGPALAALREGAAEGRASGAALSMLGLNRRGAEDPQRKAAQTS
jgi:hypothetical protein